MSRREKPLLWHIPVSHYSEKARWALAHKGIEHDRKSPVPGAHIAYALWLTRGAHKTFPVLTLDGRNIGDSTAIIAALEERWPQRPLYPKDPAERRRALELEDWFDEQIGPQIRLLAWHELRTDRERMEELGYKMIPPSMRENRFARPASGRFGSVYVNLRFRVADDGKAAAARSKVVEALDRLEAELDANGGGEFLAGDSFSVADLTAASLLYPIVNPPEGPRIIPDGNPALEEFFGPLRERPGGRWVSEMFARHRRPVRQPAEV
ncbi:MAG: glutathione S-transferase [Solirubrobacterales bacterium]|jgi:glutathione S-transferase|nr:glutathione S-transferase [Solirubrobacterales bacterium]